MEVKEMSHHITPQTNFAVEDFRQARRRAAIQELTARLTGRSTDLLSFEDVRQKLKFKSRSAQELREIPLDAIVGSVGRYHDFTRDFLPRLDSDQERWVGVKKALDKLGSLPPIEVYQIGEAYFVNDGNHRVSVARQLGLTHIEAYVTECRTVVPLTPDDQLDDLIVKAEYADFLEKSHLKEIRPKADLQVTVPGQYWELETHIEAHRFLLEQEEQREVSFKEAVGNWYDNVYLPMIQDIRERGILLDFPNRTETDLYLWIFRHQALLEKKLGWHIALDLATIDLVEEHSSRPERLAARVEEKLLHALTPSQLEAGPTAGQWRRQRIRPDDRLFTHILAPVSGAEGGWYALEFALAIAQLEGGELLGLHVVSSKNQIKSKAALAVREEFEQRCQAAGLLGELTIEAGKVIDRICERARWSDLIVMYPANPPGARFLSRLSSGSRNVIYRSCRPVLTVPGPMTLPKQILLAYDGSPKAQEGLFVAAYLAGHWQKSLVVMTVIERDEHAEKLAEAQRYLEARGVTAIYVSDLGNVADALLKMAAEQENTMIIMGGYGVTPIREAVLGSKVDHVLRESHWPILVCR
jgi:nucleotide-binding universal stress UspA family protein